MIHGIRYICNTTGYERFTQNVLYRTSIDHSLEIVNDYDIHGYIIANTFMVIPCICGSTHEILLTSENENINL